MPVFTKPTVPPEKKKLYDPQFPGHVNPNVIPPKSPEDAAEEAMKWKAPEGEPKPKPPKPVK